jgi:hypothetical protein
VRLPFRHTGNRRNHSADFAGGSAGRAGGRRNIDLFTVANAMDRRKQLIRLWQLKFLPVDGPLLPASFSPCERNGKRTCQFLETQDYHPKYPRPSWASDQMGKSGSFNSRTIRP